MVLLASLSPLELMIVLVALLTLAALVRAMVWSPGRPGRRY